MSTPKPTKPVKAWAVVKKCGRIVVESGTVRMRKRQAGELAIPQLGERVIQVLITPLTSDGREKK